MLSPIVIYRKYAKWVLNNSLIYSFRDLCMYVHKITNLRLNKYNPNSKHKMHIFITTQTNVQWEHKHQHTINIYSKEAKKKVRVTIE